ncbi:MAG: hypothetical protein ACHQY2_00945 [Candidatus Eremiobacterales bacterium]|jgi:hypothetical protein
MLPSRAKIAAVLSLLILVLAGSPSLACQWTYFPLPGGFSYPPSMRAFASNDIWALRGIGQNEILWHWNGVAWGFGPVLEPPPNVQYSLGGMSGTSDHDLWVVGSSDVNGSLEPLAAHFDGANWTPISVPDPNANACSPSPDQLLAVQSFSSTDVIAIGLYCTMISGNAVFHLSAIHWNGIRWSVVGRVEYGRFDYQAQNGGPTIAATSSSDVWLVGRKTILHFDGAHWTHMTPGRILFSAIYEVTPSDAWAVGSEQTTPMGGHVGTIVHWDGSTWSHVHVPLGSYGDSELLSVTGDGPSDAWAVGSYAVGPRQNRFLSVHWNGKRWLDAPSFDSHDGIYDIAAALNGGAVWAIGVRRTGQAVAAYHCPIQ